MGFFKTVPVRRATIFMEGIQEEREAGKVETVAQAKKIQKYRKMLNGVEGLEEYCVRHCDYRVLCYKGTRWRKALSRRSGCYGGEINLEKEWDRAVEYFG